jgi:hypothetical protein
MGNLGATELLLITFIVFGLCIIPLIIFLLTLQNTFHEIKPENRKMQPGQVWLTLIPLFGLIWQFIIVNNLADSLKLEFSQRNINVGEERPGIGIGLAYCILFCCSIIPFLGILTGLAGFICWIIYWVKISNFKATLQHSKTI